MGSCGNLVRRHVARSVPAPGCSVARGIETPPAQRMRLRASRVGCGSSRPGRARPSPLDDCEPAGQFVKMNTKEYVPDDSFTTMHVLVTLVDPGARETGGMQSCDEVHHRLVLVLGDFLEGTPSREPPGGSDWRAPRTPCVRARVSRIHRDAGSSPRWGLAPKVHPERLDDQFLGRATAGVLGALRPWASVLPFIEATP